MMVDLNARLEAATLLLTGPRSIKERLVDAYCTHLSDLEPRDLPADLQPEFTEMIDVMHRARALPGDDVIKASIRKLSSEEAHRYATLIVKLYGALAETRANGIAARSIRSLAPLAKLLAVEGNLANSQAG